MSKAVLVIDMPESINGETPCKHCSLHVAEYDDYYHHYVCQGIQTFDFDGDEWEIYNKCPLKPLVEAIPIEWIKSYIQKLETRLKDNLDLGEDGPTCEIVTIEDMLEDWEKENADFQNKR